MSDPYGPPADQPSPYQRPPAPYQQTSYEPVPPAYVEQPAAKPPTSLPPPEYHLLHLGGWPGWWRPVVGMAVAAVSTFVVSAVVWLFPFMLWFAVTGGDLLERTEALVSLDDPSPASLAYINLTLASAIPIAWFCQRLFHGLKPRWLSSVRPRIRWGYLFACVGASIVALVATVLVSLVLPGQEVTTESEGLNPWTPEVRDFVLVVLLLTPFQAAGEEYLFRGYLTQAFGGLFRSRVVAVVGPAFLFALAHGVGQDFPIFFDRFAFGLVAGILVILTGGLEAGIAMHVLNNFLAFGFALAFSDMGSALNPTGGSWWQIPVTLTQSIVYLVCAVWLARMMKVARQADLTVLAASRGLVYRSPTAAPE
jgi:membrane protease YdiL (CAAX protease family)